VTVLPTLTDVDTVTEAAEVAAAAPRTRFASQWRTFATPASAPAPAGVAVSVPAPSAAGPAAGPVPAGVAR
jgi:hypothetical protein